MTRPPEGVFAGFAMGTREQMLALQRDLEIELPEQLYVHVLRSPRYRGYMCEIAPFGVSKWTGVLRLAAEAGIAPAEICAAGDDVNDIPMIQGPGLGSRWAMPWTRSRRSPIASLRPTTTTGWCRWSSGCWSTMKTAASAAGSRRLEPRA